MPIHTGAALAVSLIPAAVIIVYNLMEHGIPGGTLKDFINRDNAVTGSASFLSVKNISINTNDSIVNIGNSIEELTTTILNPVTTPPSTTTTTTRTTTSPKTEQTTTTASTTTTRITTTETTTTPVPETTTPVPENFLKLPVCCDNVRASGGRLIGNCGNGDSVRHLDLLLIGQHSSAWNVPAHLMATEKASKFSLQTVNPGCKDGKFIGQLPWNTEANSPDHFLPDGMLKYKNEFYRTDEYCIRGNGQIEGILEVQICKIKCDNIATPCVRKCCAYDEIYSMGMKGQRGGCIRMDDSRNESLWSPTLYDDDGRRITSEELRAVGVKPHIIQTNPTRFRHLCPRNATTVFPFGQQVADFLAAVLRYPFSSLRFTMRKDGWLMNPNDTQKNIAISKTMKTTKYCIDGVQNYGESKPFTNLEEQTVLFLCLGVAEELAILKDQRSENLVAAATNNQPMAEVLISTTVANTPTEPTTTTTTTEPSTATTPTTTTRRTTTATTPTTTTPPPSTTTKTTRRTTTATTPTTTTPPPSTTTKTTPKSTTTQSPQTTTSTASTTTSQPTTTFIPTTTLIPTTNTFEPSLPPPVLPICCPLDPEANDDNRNDISHHCKSTGGDSRELISNNVTPINKNFSTLWIASPNFMFTHKITKFKLEVKPLKCEKWTKAFVHNLGKLLSPTEPVLMPDGMLKMGNDYFRDGEFCLNGVFPNIVEVLVCKTNCSDPNTPCIQKCCAPNEVYSLGVGGKKRGCIPLSDEDAPFNPPLYKDISTKVSTAELESMTPHLVQKYPPKFQYSCYKNVTLVFPFSSDVVQLMSPLAQINLEFKLRQDGKVIYKHPSIRNASGGLIESAFSTYNFCVDGIRNFGEAKAPYINQENQTILFVCAVSPPGAS